MAHVRDCLTFLPGHPLGRGLNPGRRTRGHGGPAAHLPHLQVTGRRGAWNRAGTVGSPELQERRHCAWRRRAHTPPGTFHAPSPVPGAGRGELRRGVTPPGCLWASRWLRSRVPVACRPQGCWPVLSPRLLQHRLPRSHTHGAPLRAQKRPPSMAKVRGKQPLPQHIHGGE